MSDFSIFELTVSDQDNIKRPDWPEFNGASSNNAIFMYELVIERRNTIVQQLNDGIDLAGKSKKIVLSKISNGIGRNADYLNKREFPNLVQFIKETNNQLARLKPTGKSKGTKRKSTKGELALRIKELETILYTRNVEELINNKVLGQVGKYQQDRIHLQNENDDLQDRLRKVRKDYNAAIDQITELVNEVQGLKKQVRDLGGEVNQEATLRPL